MTRAYTRNGQQILIGASRSASRSRSTSPPAATDYEFGVLTTAGNAPVDIGVAGITITGGDTSGHFQTADSGGRTLLSVSSAGATAQLSGSPYSLTLSNGSTITVSGIANAITVDSLAELQTIIRSTATPYGRKIYLREGGDYSTAMPLDAGRLRTVAYTGTWTPPSNRTPYHQGIDLDTGNYVRVMAHTGEAPAISRQFSIEAQATGTARVRFTGISFTATRVSTEFSADGQVSLLGTSEAAFDYCTFQGSDSSITGDTDRYAGIALKPLNSRGCHDIVIQDCVINDSYDGILGLTGNDRICIVGNTVRRAWNDGVKFSHCSQPRYCWNFIIDKLHPDGGSGAHGDFLQIVGSGATAADDYWIVGNVHARGAGREGFNDGQAIWVADLNAASTYQQPVIVGNRTFVGFARHISLLAADRASPDVSTDAFIRSNTTVAVLGNDVTNERESPKSNEDYSYNLVSTVAAASGTNIHVNLTTGIDSVIVGERTGITDAAIGSTLAEVVANTNVKSGSAPDTASPKVGAHQDYINYANRTLNLPYSLPAEPT